MPWKRIPPLERFWPKVKIRSPDECWEWQGAVSGLGYGQFTIQNRGGVKITMPAHRFSWEITNNRTAPKGMHICHACDNPPCCNPAHLWLGTASENRMDASRKGRLPKIKQSIRAFTDSEITEIRKVFQLSGKSYAAIARAYGFGSAMTVWQAVNGERYGHVPTITYATKPAGRIFTCQNCNGKGCEHCNSGRADSKTRGRWLAFKRQESKLSEYERLERKEVISK